MLEKKFEFKLEGKRDRKRFLERLLIVPPYRSHLKMKVSQSCLTLCYPIDYTVHGILQARILEWVAFLFSRGSSQLRD